MLSIRHTLGAVARHLTAPTRRFRLVGLPTVFALLPDPAEAPEPPPSEPGA